MEPAYLTPPEGGVTEEGWYILNDDGAVIQGPFPSEEDALEWIKDNTAKGPGFR